MTLLTIPEIRKSEILTMQNESITSLDLMERAGKQFAKVILTKYNSYSNIYIYCGPGNNGGDGLVIARYLANSFRVIVIDCTFNKRVTPEFAYNFQQLKRFPISIVPFSQFQKTQIPDKNTNLIIDALFGIGLTRPLEGAFKDVVNHFCQISGHKIAVDIPSGLFCDDHTPQENPCTRVAETLTFQFLKLGLVQAENYNRIGEVHVLDIGLQLPTTSKDNTSNSLTYESINQEYAQQHYRPPFRFAHKGTQGHGLLIAGSRTMPGAALLSAKSAMRTGIGKLTLHAPTVVTNKLTPFLPEAICSEDLNSDLFSEPPHNLLVSSNAIAIGPGLGTAPQTTTALLKTIDLAQQPLILDADALNILAKNKNYLSHLPQNSILTPHIKEFERLTTKADNDFERLRMLQRFAQQYKINILLKGAYTVVADTEGKLSFNFSGNSGLATAGSGDVLTGIILALLAQKYPAKVAARLGAYLHGLAADCALQSHTQNENSLIASDLPSYLGMAFQNITHHK